MIAYMISHASTAWLAMSGTMFLAMWAALMWVERREAEQRENARMEGNDGIC